MPIMPDASGVWIYHTKEFCMKKQNKTWTVLGLVFALVIGLTFAGCDSGSGGGAASLTGTWKEPGGETIVFTATNFTVRSSTGSTEASGTYTTSGSTVTFNATSLGGYPGTATFTGTVNGTTMSVGTPGGTKTYTKQ
jgi:hypothetical protein